MTQEQNEKIKAARDEIQNLEHQQATTYSKLAAEFNFSKPQENYFFDYIFNSGTKETFKDYLISLGRSDLL